MTIAALLLSALFNALLLSTLHRFINAAPTPEGEVGPARFAAIYAIALVNGMLIAALYSSR